VRGRIIFHYVSSRYFYDSKLLEGGIYALVLLDCNARQALA